MLEMANELKSLRAAFNAHQNSPATDVLQTSHSVASSVLQSPFNAGLQPKSPMSLAFQRSLAHPGFNRDFSNACNVQSQQRTASPLDFIPSPEVEVRAEKGAQLAQTVTPNPSPHLSFVETSGTPPTSSGRYAKRTHERMLSVSSSDGNSSSSSSSSTPVHRRKRSNHHDTQCYTIHVSCL